MAKLRKSTKADISAVFSKDVVVRKYRNQTVLSTVTKPKKSKSAKKRQANERMSDAIHYAKAILKIPGKREMYSKGINRRLSNAHLVALTDYLNPPQVHYVKMIAYSGAVGDQLRIKATDDFQVTKVHVEITSGKRKILEDGEAIRYGRKPAIWTYNTKVANPALKGTVVKVTAKDNPGNRTTIKITWEEGIEIFSGEELTC